MKKQIKVTGVKKAVGQYRRWIEQDCRRNADIVMDVQTGEVWCDVFIDDSTFNIYPSYVVSLIEVFYSEYCGVNDKKDFNYKQLQAVANNILQGKHDRLFDFREEI